MLKAVKKTRIPEEIADQIIQLIRKGDLKPGDRLSPERELAQQLRVSRASVREAMRLLDMKGLLNVRQGAGTFISDDTVEATVQAFSSLLSYTANTVSDIFEMRLILEPHVVALAAERATPDDIRKMEEILDKQEADVASGGSGVDFDTDFHFTIAQATQNPSLVAVIQATSDILNQSRDAALQSPERSRSSLQSHRLILDAIKRKRPKEAEYSMTHHIAEIDRKVHNLPPEWQLSKSIVNG